MHFEAEKDDTISPLEKVVAEKVQQKPHLTSYSQQEHLFLETMNSYKL